MNLQNFKSCVDEIKQSDLDKFKDILTQFNSIILLGNGGSNSITLHIAQDYCKMLYKRAVSFGDTSRMSCYANDYGWENAYRQFLIEFADDDSLVILISSSGNSENILKSADYCLEKNIALVTLSGFSPDNKLHTQYQKHALQQFYVNSKDYGIVECIHKVILHSVI
jgi:D-sedoheptulose 7-phosphate isomerase